MTATRVLIVDDEPSVRVLLERILRGMNCEVTAVEDGLEAQAKLAQGAFDLVITDLRMPGADGFAVLLVARELEVAPPVIILTGDGSTADCVRAMRAGATDFIGKPFDADELRQVVRAALRSSSAPEDTTKAATQGETRASQAALVGDSPRMRAVLDEVERFAPSDVPVILVGERDTGKQAIARLLHATSGRAGQPFVVANCAVMNPQDVEETLFGDGGKVALSGRGTLFLTGVERLESELCSRIARTLFAHFSSAANAARTTMRVVVDIDLQPDDEAAAASTAGAMQDILGAVMIAIPALRERAEDVPLLAEYFLDVENRRAGRRVNVGTLLSALKSYPWPGNLNELETRISRYVTDAPPEPNEAVANALVVPIDRVTAMLILADGTRREVVLPHGPGQPIEALFESREPFLAVKEGGKTRIYARSVLACVIVGAANQSAYDESLPRSHRLIRTWLRSGVVLEGELRYIAVEGRGRVTDVLNENAQSFSLHTRDAVHHVAKTHVFCVEEC